MAKTQASTIATFAGTNSRYAVALPAAKLSPLGTVYLDPYLDFAADDSGAMAHVITDEKGAHIVRTLGGEHPCATAPRVFPWFGERGAPISRTHAA